MRENIFHIHPSTTKTTAAAIPQIAVSAELVPIEGRDDSAMLCYGIRQPLPRVLLAGA